MGSKKKSRIKKPRRASDRGSLFPKREARDIWIKDHFLRIAFPDREERQAYITALIKGFDEELIIPDTQFTR